MRQKRKRQPSRGNYKHNFIDLAQEAFEEADKEEEKRGVIGEVMNALIANTGANVISEQLRSQDVIQQAAEKYGTRRLNPSSSSASIDSLKEPVDEKTEEHIPTHSSESLWSLAEYSWRLFRLLILASLVGLACHFKSSMLIHL